MNKGDIINQLELLEEVYKCDENRKRKYWKCKCLRCGKIKEIREDNLKTQQTCGCLSKAHQATYYFLRGRYGR